MATVHVCAAEAAETPSSAQINAVLSEWRLAKTVSSTGASAVIPGFSTLKGEIVLVTVIGGDVFVDIGEAPEAGADRGFLLADGMSWPFVATAEGLGVAIKDLA